MALVAIAACNTARDAALDELRSAEPSKRARAAERLAGVGDAEALPALRRALRDRDPEVRRTSIATLAALGDQGAMDGIIERLDDASTQVRLAAVRALGDLGGTKAARLVRKKARDALVDRSLADREMPVRRAARRSLEVLGLPRAAQVRALADRRRAELRERMGKGGEEAIAAARLLLEDDDASAADLLVEAVIEGAFDPADRPSVLRSLGGASLGEDARRRLAALEPADAAAFLEGLAASLVPDRIERLRAAVTAPDAPAVVRRAAVRGLASERLDAATARVFCAAVADPDPEIASLAARTIASSSTRCETPVEPGSPLEVLAWVASWRSEVVPLLVQRLAREPGSPEAWEAASRLDDRTTAIRVLERRGPQRAPAPSAKLVWGGAPSAPSAGVVVWGGVRSALSEIARREVESFRSAATRWIPARTWAAMAPGDDAEPPAPPRDTALRGQGALAELLRRFPPRNASDEIWPSRGDPERVRAAVLAATRSEARDASSRGSAVERASALASAPEAVLRAAAAASLAIVLETAASAAQPIAETLATDPEPDVRGAAAAALVATRSAAWVERLLKDPDESVRREVALALADRPFPIPGAALRDLVRRDASVESVQALARCLGRDARTDLGDLLRRDEATVGPDLRVAILQALAAAGDRRDVAIVGTALDSPEPMVRAAAVAALCRLRGPDSTRLLRDHRDDFDAAVRRAIAGCAANPR